MALEAQNGARQRYPCPYLILWTMLHGATRHALMRAGSHFRASRGVESSDLKPILQKSSDTLPIKAGNAPLNEKDCAQ